MTHICRRKNDLKWTEINLDKISSEQPNNLQLIQIDHTTIR